MKNPVIAFIHSFSDLTKSISRFANNINAIKDGIEKEKVLIENLHGFDKIYQLVNTLANSIPFSLELIKMIEKEMINHQVEWQIIYKLEDGYLVALDPRKNGQAEVYWIEKPDKESYHQQYFFNKLFNDFPRNDSNA